MSLTQDFSVFVSLLAFFNWLLDPKSQTRKYCFWFHYNVGYQMRMNFRNCQINCPPIPFISLQCWANWTVPRQKSSCWSYLHSFMIIHQGHFSRRFIMSQDQFLHLIFFPSMNTLHHQLIHLPPAVLALSGRLEWSANTGQQFVTHCFPAAVCSA